MLAEATPPTRSCRMTAVQAITIGNTANMPDAKEPMLVLIVVTTTTTMAAESARTEMSQRERMNFAGGPEVR